MRVTAGSSASAAKRAEDVEGIDLSEADYCTLLENSLERDEDTSSRAIFAPTSRLNKKLGSPPPYLSHVASSNPSHVGTSDTARASSSGHGVVQKSTVATGSSRKAEAKVIPRQLDPLDLLARGAIARDQQYGHILDDYFATASLGEEIDLTLFLLLMFPMLCPIHLMVDPDVYRRDLDQTITLAELKRTKSLLPFLEEKYEKVQQDWHVLDRENKDLRSPNDVSSKEVRKLKGQLAEAEAAAAKASNDLARIDEKLSDQALAVRDLQNDLALKRWKSQESKDAAAAVEHRCHDLRSKVTRFSGSGIDCIVCKLLSSDKFNATLARILTFSITSRVERGSRMGHIDAKFEEAS
nr:hypothetical protein [Tanacetum cinerariifolium]